MIPWIHYLITHIIYLTLFHNFLFSVYFCLYFLWMIQTLNHYTIFVCKEVIKLLKHIDLKLDPLVLFRSKEASKIIDNWILKPVIKAQHWPETTCHRSQRRCLNPNNNRITKPSGVSTTGTIIIVSPTRYRCCSMATVVYCLLGSTSLMP